MIIKEFDSPIESEFPVVDVEIENDISSDWDYEKGEVVTVGILYGNKIKIIQKEKDDDYVKFMTSIEVEIRKHKSIYAFNYLMERGCLHRLTTFYFDVKEIKPFKGKGWSKDKFFKELCKLKNLKLDLEDPLNGDGSKVMDYYKKEKYEDIIQHNLNCVVKEAYILKYKKDLFEHFKENISPSGWFEE